MLSVGRVNGCSADLRAAPCYADPMDPAIQRAALREALEELMRGRERARRLIVRAGAHWQVLSVTSDRRELRHQSVKSSRLPTTEKLGTREARKLRDLGFEKPPGVRDWQRVLPRPDLDGLAKDLLFIAHDIYGSEAALELDLEIDDREHPENPELIDAMRKLARPGYDPSDRHAMYNAMANATFLLPIDPDAGDEVDAEDAWLVVERQGDRPVYAAFTDFESLRTWRPLERDYLPVHGSEFFELLEQRRAAILRVNPDGDVGGELYAHELESLAEGVRRFLRRRLN